MYFPYIFVCHALIVQPLVNIRSSLVGQYCYLECVSVLWETQGVTGSFSCCNTWNGSMPFVCTRVSVELTGCHQHCVHDRSRWTSTMFTIFQIFLNFTLTDWSTHNGGNDRADLLDIALLFIHAGHLPVLVLKLWLLSARIFCSTWCVSTFHKD